MTLTFLIISIIAIIILLLYARWLIKIIKTKEEEADSLAVVVSDYVGHVKSVHEMEMFYGDPSLQKLIDHGNNLVQRIEDFDYLILEQQEEEEGGQE